MKRRVLMMLFACASLSGVSHGSIVISIAGGLLQSAQNQSLPAGSLLQLINLGGDGIFNPIDLADGGSQWVSGDDTLLSAIFTTGGGAESDFSSTNGFDLFKGADTAGRLERVFEFAENVVPAGLRLGIRWFPGLMANDFASITLAPGQAYGQFSRQQGPIHGGGTWMVPSNGANLAFDPLVTKSAGGEDPESFGIANLAVIPEPDTIVLAFAGLISLLSMRART
ncbi:MAG: hypothetical protein JWL59_2224 [Chthoniobacteraceae bacterium]|nr:hypothetical protein [Chthoniobacteraceae bacterium]